MDLMALRAADVRYAFAPFDGDERVVLGMHVNAVADLMGTTFAQTGRLTWTLPVELKDARRTGADDALEAAIAPFRRLVRDGEKGSFQQVRKLLRAHSVQCDTTEARWASAMLDVAGRQHRQLLRQSPYGHVMEEQPDGSTKILKPRELLDDFINGRLMHGDLEKRARVDQWTGFHKMGLIDAVTNLTEFYSRFAIGPILVVRESSLHR